ANEKATTIGAEKSEVEKDLEAAKPALLEAESALNAIKPSDIQNLKALKNPPVVIKIIFDGVLLLRRRTMIKCNVVEEKGTLCYKDNYSDASKMMNEPSFLTDLQQFAKEEITDEDCELLFPYMECSLFTLEAAGKASGLAVGLCKWVKAMVTYHTIAKVVIPKMDALRLKETELAGANKKLSEANAELQEAQDMLDAMQALPRPYGNCREKIRWTEQSAEFADEISRLVGDCARACAFMSYCGPFNKTFRDKLVAFSKDLSLIEMLTNDSVRGEWNLQGLPTDDLSVQNGILTTRASRYPIMVDPQGQGLTWTRAKEAQNGLVETNFSDKAFRNHLEDCLSYGKPMLLANVEEELDPLLDAAFVRKGKQCVIQLGDKEVDVEPETFQLFITSRMPNPHFTPELSARVTVIDFTGLEDQLLARVVSQEKPELQEERQKLLEEVNAYKKKIMELQDDLLFRLANCTGSLLDDPEIIDVLNITKKTSAEDKLRKLRITTACEECLALILGRDEKLRNARDAELRITTACEEFRPVANRGSVLYFLIAEMNAIDVMYQTSLAQFISVFQLSMVNSPKAAIPAKRITNIIEELTFNTFLYIGRGLFEKHKEVFALLLALKVQLVSEVFALLLALKVQLVSEVINQDHFDCFLKGGAALDIATERKKPKPWIPDIVWLNCLELSRKLSVFKDLPELISRNEQLWQQWLDKLHKLLLIRSMRMDRTMIVAHEYISDTLGAKYVDSHPLNIEVMHAESTERTPFICILSMGSDPTELIMGLAKKKKKEVQSVSMGQGQEVIARRYVSSGVATGSWVLLQNTHLGLKYLQELEETIAKLEEIDTEFRVWVTAEPHPKFPIGLLQMSIKFTNEAPVGMKAGMKRSYAWINQDMLDIVVRPEWETLLWILYHACDMLDIVARPEWKTLLWILCHAHCVVQARTLSVYLERRKYGAIGWTVPYEFNQSDLNASTLFLQNHLLDMDAKKAKDVTWSTIRYMIAEIQYGGRITDDWDRRMMITFAEKFFQQSSLEVGSELHAGYAIPMGNDVNVYRAAIENLLPEVDSPEVFGLNLNADLQFRTTQAGEVFDTIMETQPKGGGGGAGKSREEVVTDMCIDLLGKLPKDFSKDEASLSKMGTTKPINVCFRQEIDVLQRSLTVVRQTLKDLQLAIAGTIVMSEMLADSIDSLVVAKVPQAWLKNAWYCPTVSVWFQSLLSRYEQFDRWLKNSSKGSLLSRYEGGGGGSKHFDRWLKAGRPKSFWLPGFSNGQGFLTAMMQEGLLAAMQEVARGKQGWALDDVVMFAEVTKLEEGDVREPPPDGIYVHGLFLEGASWNKKEQHLIEAPPKVLVAHLPVMYITGVIKSAKKVEYMKYECPVEYMTYECPVYFRFDPRKRGMTAAQPNFMFSPEIRTIDPPSKWILRGVALLTYQGDAG
ncbi:dynein heavy chain and region D6 of dynein motor-domain-containing protein, partial [Baffinella frigidus]